MPQRSAGILLYRLTDAAPEVLPVHPGGPFWAKKDDGAWSIPIGRAEAEASGYASALTSEIQSDPLPGSGAIAVL